MAEKNLWDPDEHVASAVLGGVTGTIQPGSRFIRHNYGGKAENESTALQITVTAESLDKPRVLLIACGALWPSEEPQGGKATEGKHFTGQPNKGSNFHDFLVNLKAAGFPLQRFAEMGAEALDGAIITFKAFEKTVGGGKGKKGEVKVYEVPGTFVGFEGDVAEVALEGPSEIEQEAAALVQAAVEEKGEIPRGQLGLAIGPQLKGNANKAKILGLLLKDTFLATVEGITFDKKTVKKAA